MADEAPDTAPEVDVHAPPSTVWFRLSSGVIYHVETASLVADRLRAAGTEEFDSQPEPLVAEDFRPVDDEPEDEDAETEDDDDDLV